MIPLRVVMSGEPLGQKSVEGVSEVPADLHHPGFARAWRDPGQHGPPSTPDGVIGRDSR